MRCNFVNNQGDVLDEKKRKKGGCAMDELKRFLAKRMDGNPSDGGDLSWNDLIRFLMNRWPQGWLWLANYLKLADESNVVWLFAIFPPKVEVEVARIFRSYKSVMDAGTKLDLDGRITMNYGEFAKVLVKLADVCNKLAGVKK